MKKKTKEQVMGVGLLFLICGGASAWFLLRLPLPPNAFLLVDAH